MSEFWQFLVEHWQLSSLFLALVAYYVWFEYSQDLLGSTNVNPEEAVAMLNHQHAVMLDIRSRADFVAGHVIGAMHVERDESETKMNRFKKYAEKPVIVTCNSGKTAQKFVQRLNGLGLKKVYCLSGGMNAWCNAGLPVVQGE